MSILAEAVKYATRGWPIILTYGMRDGVCLCSKGAMCESPGKHPLEGCSQKDASTDVEVIERRINAHSSLAPNLAILTGNPSGIFVLDIDPRNGGDDTLTKLEEEHGQLPITLVADTGGGGTHIYFRIPDDTCINTSSRILGAGIDVKATSKSDRLPGYVLVPPSVTSAPYRWRNYSLPIAAPPAWLLDLLIVAESESAAQFEGKQTIPEGQRHNYLVSVAGKLHHNGLSHQAILDALISENHAKCRPPLPEEEVTSIASGITKYSSPLFHLNDIGNAKRLVYRHHPTLRHCFAQNAWYIWEGRYWAKDQKGQINEFAKQTVEWMHEDALLKGGDLGAALRKHATQSGRVDRIAAMVHLARSEPDVSVYADQLDDHPLLLNCPNCTLDLETGKGRSHDRKELLTKITPTSYFPDAKSELWEQFLRETTNNDEELQTFLQRISGYALSGLTTEESIFFVYGPGGTGKSTYFETFKAVIGEHYCKTASFTTFLKNKSSGGGGGARSDIARLPGARLVTAVETEEGKSFAADLLKVSTGGDKITTRDLYQSEFEFMPQYKIWLAANSKPRVRDDDSGIWRRLLLIPFYHVVPNPNKELKNTLKASRKDREGILAWAARGFLDWRKYGWIIPTVVRNETKAYKNEMDTLNAWIDDSCQKGESLFAGVRELWQSYDEWMKRQPASVRDARIDNTKVFVEQLQKRGFIHDIVNQSGRISKVMKGIAIVY